MKNVKLLIAFLVSVTLLIGCGQQSNIDPQETIQGQDSKMQEEETTEATESIEEKTIPEIDASESTSTAVELIPVAIWQVIDVNQAGKVTVTEFVDYYTVKVQEEEKLSQEEAEQKFQNLDRDSSGELTKEEATGEK